MTGEPNLSDEPTQPEEVSAETTNEIDASAILIAKLTDERDALKDQLMRSMADFQNSRRRMLQESEQARAFATEKLIAELLPVLDNFERTIAAVEAGATVESLVEGVRLVDRQLRQVLHAQNLARIPAVGEHFDPEIHEAIAMEHTDEHEEGKITHELEAGYRIKDRVLRPAKVRVAKKKDLG